MLQNMLMTTLTPLIGKKETTSWENHPFATVWPEKVQQKPKDITRTIKKKPKRVRTAFSTDQIRTLERTFSRYKYINSERRHELAKSLNIAEKCIKIWFQNRRMKEKKESSESSCESSSESNGNETPSLSTSPPPEAKAEPSNPEYLNQYFNVSPAEYSYQLPTFYGMPQNTYTANDVSAFYQENGVYPTQYYPIETNYPNIEYNNGYQYGSEMSQYWTSNQSPYYGSF